jgi:hypothetical protein
MKKREALFAAVILLFLVGGCEIETHELAKARNQGQDKVPSVRDATAGGGIHHVSRQSNALVDLSGVRGVQAGATAPRPTASTKAFSVRREAEAVQPRVSGASRKMAENSVAPCPGTNCRPIAFRPLPRVQVTFVPCNSEPCGYGQKPNVWRDKYCCWPSDATQVEIRGREFEVSQGTVLLGVYTNAEGNTAAWVKEGE